VFTHDSSFPGQEHIAGNSKIPSVVYYDSHGKLVAAGAETDTAAVILQAEDNNWIKTDLYDCAVLRSYPNDTIVTDSSYDYVLVR